MPRTLRAASTIVATLAAAFAAAALTARPARAQHVEGGVYAGWHIFSSTNELGAVEGETRNIVKDSYLFGLRVAFILHPRLSIEGEGSIIPTRNELDDGDTVLVFGYRVQLDVTLTPASMGPKLFAVAGVGALTSLGSDSKDIAADTDPALHVGLGAKIPMGEVWGLRFDGRVLFPPTTSGENSATTDFEITIGAYKRFGDVAPVEKKKEEPPATVDSDGDGLMDDVDSCPGEMEDLDSFQDTDGCPEADNDNDGVLDGDDQCKDDPEDKDKWQDEDGCPEADNDNDGIDDANEACDNQPEDKDKFEDEDGCPDPDNDGDGVLDGDDNCDDKPETKNGFQDGDGCPDDVPAEVLKFTGTIKGITFVTKKSDIKKGSFKVLDQAVKVLQQYPDVRIEIQGHTDDVGKREDNLKLSQGRADAVKAYLVKKGITADRITAVGYGPDKPAVPGKSKGARAANRRVEFQIITGGSEGEKPAPTGDKPAEGPRENDL